MAKRAAVLENKNVDMELVAKCLARAIVEGDIVNFRSLFLSWSPARKDSTERLESDKYTHFRPRPNQESEMGFRDALKSVKEPATWTHIQREFGEKRPAQLPSDLLLLLADNAVRLGKYSAASQAYELLRIRPKMQQMFLEQACVALDAGQMSKAVKGFRIASGLEYNYSAFPEPLPLVADYQTRSLGLHGEYPERPENTVGFQPVDQFIRTAVAYLLLTPEMTAHLEKHPIEVRIAFL